MTEPRSYRRQEPRTPKHAARAASRRDVLLMAEGSPDHGRLRRALEAAGFACRTVANLVESRAYQGRQVMDLLVLDGSEDEVGTLTRLREIRRESALRDVPVLVLIGERAPLEERIRVLDAGADDYMLVPVAESEFVARIRALLRRCAARVRVESDAESIIAVAGLELNPAARRVFANGALVALSPTEFDLLRFFMSHPEQVHSRKVLLEQVRGPYRPVEDRAVDVFVRRLRLGLKPHGYAGFIQSVYGTGYRFATVGKV